MNESKNAIQTARGKVSPASLCLLFVALFAAAWAAKDLFAGHQIFLLSRWLGAGPSLLFTLVLGGLAGRSVQTRRSLATRDRVLAVILSSLTLAVFLGTLQGMPEGPPWGGAAGRNMGQLLGQFPAVVATGLAGLALVLSLMFSANLWRREGAVAQATPRVPPFLGLREEVAHEAMPEQDGLEGATDRQESDAPASPAPVMESSPPSLETEESLAAPPSTFTPEDAYLESALEQAVAGEVEGPRPRRRILAGLAPEGEVQEAAFVAALADEGPQAPTDDPDREEALAAIELEEETPSLFDPELLETEQAEEAADGEDTPVEEGEEVEEDEDWGNEEFAEEIWEEVDSEEEEELEEPVLEQEEHPQETLFEEAQEPVPAASSLEPDKQAFQPEPAGLEVRPHAEPVEAPHIRAGLQKNAQTPHRKPAHSGDWAPWADRTPSVKPRASHGRRPCLLGGEARNDGELYRLALSLLSREDHCSPSLLQRRLGLSHEQAARLIQMLEQEGLVGPALPSGRREILADAGLLEHAQTTET